MRDWLGKRTQQKRLNSRWLNAPFWEYPRETQCRWSDMIGDVIIIIIAVISIVITLYQWR